MFCVFFHCSDYILSNTVLFNCCPIHEQLSTTVISPFATLLKVHVHSYNKKIGDNNLFFKYIFIIPMLVVTHVYIIVIAIVIVIVIVIVIAIVIDIIPEYIKISAYHSTYLYHVYLFHKGSK